MRAWFEWIDTAGGWGMWWVGPFVAIAVGLAQLERR